MDISVTESLGPDVCGKTRTAQQRAASTVVPDRRADPMASPQTALTWAPSLTQAPP
jgi:hypothetical protein